MNLLAQFKKISCLVFDMDGVLTDGRVLVLPEGVQARQMHVKDGLALQMALKKSYRVYVLSGSQSPESVQRLTKLGLKEVHMGVHDKAAFIKKLMDEQRLPREEVLFMGDDLPDLSALKIAGLSCCPADAVQEIKTASDYISPVNGGWGCVRDVIEKVLKSRGDWEFSTEMVST